MYEAGAKLYNAAEAGRVNLDWMYGSWLGSEVRQVVLVAPSSGRTAAVFISEPQRGGEPGGADVARAERVAALEAGIQELCQTDAIDVAVLQALPEPEDLTTINALREAGFVVVGELVYLRRWLGKGAAASANSAALPEGYRLRTVEDMGGIESCRDVLLRVLEASYERTLDCPGLCGIRETTDVLDSHIAVGEFDPSLWFVLESGSEPVGCMLLSKCSDQRTVELVYLGLGASARGRRLSTTMLAHGISTLLGKLPRSGYDWLVCAVDRQNAPAVSLYRNAGFRPCGERVALVRRVGALRT